MVNFDKSKKLHPTKIGLLYNISSFFFFKNSTIYRQSIYRAFFDGCLEKRFIVVFGVVVNLMSMTLPMFSTVCQNLNCSQVNRYSFQVHFCVRSVFCFQINLFFDSNLQILHMMQYHFPSYPTYDQPVFSNQSIFSKK